MKYLVLFFLFLFTGLVCAQNSGVSYVSPQPNSHYVGTGTTIIVRFNAPVSLADVVPKVGIVGTESGVHTFNVKHDATATIYNLQPHSPFSPNEKVTVTIAGLRPELNYSWEFYVAQTQLSNNALEVLAMPPADLPVLNITKVSNPAPGSILIAPNTRVAAPAFGPYLQVLDSAGTPTLWKQIPGYAFDFRSTPDGRLTYTLFQSAGSGALASSVVTIVDTNLNNVSTVNAANGYNIAMHSFKMLPNGNRVVMCQENLIVDMRSQAENGHPAANVQQALIQEITPDGVLVFQWRSLDHLPITATYEDISSASLRFIHNNMVEYDTDGNYLLSLRHMSAIVKVNRSTGEVMWVLGGKLNQFEMKQGAGVTEPAEFSYQHDVRRLSNGNISMFDNGTGRTPQYTRAAEYKLDEVNKVCELVWTYRHSPDIYTSLQGSVQTLPNGNRLLAWGSAVLDSNPAITEVTPTGEVVLEGYYPRMMYPYTVEKTPFPTGRASATVMVEEILKGNFYTYTRSPDTVGLLVTWHTVESFFYNATIARRYQFAPVDARFESRSGKKIVSPRLFPVRVTMTQEGMTKHMGEFRFKAGVLGLAPVASKIVVYYRENLGTGAFVPMRTNYNLTTDEIVVDTMDVGEYAFGLASPSTIQSHPARTIGPVNGKKVLINSKVVLHCSPQGDATNHRYVVRTAAGDVVKEIFSVKDRESFIPTAAGQYTWQVYSWYQAGNDTISAVSESDLADFEVGERYLELVRPTDDALWTKDSSYAINWESNVAGTVQIQLMKGSDVTVAITDSVPISAGGFLWKVPFSVPVDSGYTIRIKTKDGDTLNLSNVGSASITIRGVFNSVNEDKLLQQFSIAPNPADGSVYVGGSLPINSIQVYSATGIMVTSQPVVGTGANVNVSELPVGWYFVLVNSIQGTVVKKLNIIR